MSPGKSENPDGTSTRRACCSGGIAAFATYIRIDEPIVPVSQYSGDERQDLVPGVAALDVAAAVAPRPQLLDDPRGEPGGRVGEPDGGGLRLRAVDGTVGTLGREPGRGLVEERALLRSQSLPVAGEARDAAVHAVDGDDPVGVVEPEEPGSRALPMSPPAAPNRSYPSTLISSAQRAATPTESGDEPRGRSEYP